MKYRVEVKQTVIEACVIEVEADNEDDAREAAEKKAMAGDVQWEFDDSHGWPEATYITALEPENTV
jgi:hypothetical protein